MRHSLAAAALSAMAAAGMGVGSAEASDALAWIDVAQDDGLTRLSAMAAGPDGAAYRFVVETEGRAGRSRTAQGGAIRGDGTRPVADVSVRIDDGARWRADLTVTRGGEEIARAILSGGTGSDAP
jgi:hypothetical protein